MLDYFSRKFFNKDIILFHRHRNSDPLLTRENKKRFFFIHCPLIWKCTGIFGRKSRARYRVMALILSFIRPRYIIDINWISRLGGLYLVWCRNNRPSRFVVVQHGSYIGGIITDNAHKYAKCDVVLCWGEHARQEFLRYNSQTDVQIMVWGNPLYNRFDRSVMDFNEHVGTRVLFVSAVVKGKRKAAFEDCMNVFKQLSFEIFVKEHNYQASLSEPFRHVRKIKGPLYEILQEQRFDIVVSDISTSLIDSLFFKNRTLFFSPEGELPEYTHNAYSKYMRNIAYNYKTFTSREDVLACIDLEAQENLLKMMVTVGDNDLSKLAAI